MDWPLWSQESIAVLHDPIGRPVPEIPVKNRLPADPKINTWFFFNFFSSSRRPRRLIEGSNDSPWWPRGRYTYFTGFWPLWTRRPGVIPYFLIIFWHQFSDFSYFVTLPDLLAGWSKYVMTPHDDPGVYIQVLLNFDPRGPAARGLYLIFWSIFDPIFLDLSYFASLPDLKGGWSKYVMTPNDAPRVDVHVYKVFDPVEPTARGL